MSNGTDPRHVNRRLAARVACHLTVQYRSGSTWRPATAMDLSVRGCRLRLGEDLVRTSDVSVLIEHPGKDGGSPLRAEVKGNIIWSRHEGLSHQAGIQFTSEPEGLHEILRVLG